MQVSKIRENKNQSKPEFLYDDQYGIQELPNIEDGLQYQNEFGELFFREPGKLCASGKRGSQNGNRGQQGDYSHVNQYQSEQQYQYNTYRNGYKINQQQKNREQQYPYQNQQKYEFQNQNQNRHQFLNNRQLQQQDQDQDNVQDNAQDEEQSQEYEQGSEYEQLQLQQQQIERQDHLMEDESLAIDQGLQDQTYHQQKDSKFVGAEGLYQFDCQMSDYCRPETQLPSGQFQYPQNQDKQFFTDHLLPRFDSDQQSKNHTKNNHKLTTQQHPSIRSKLRNHLTQTALPSVVSGPERSVPYQRANPKCLPLTYFMNNLLALTPYMPPEHLRVYIYHLSIKHRIPFNKILISYSAEYIIYKFYKTQHINCSLSSKYIIAELQRIFPQFLLETKIYNIWVIKKIITILWNRFRIHDVPYQDSWFVAIVKKSRKYWKNGGYQVSKLIKQLSQSVCGNSSISEPPNSQEPSPQQISSLQFTNIKQYLKKHPINKAIQIQETDDEFMENSDKLGLDSKLLYYVELKKREKEASDGKDLGKDGRDGRDLEKGKGRKEGGDGRDGKGDGGEEFVVDRGYKEIMFQISISKIRVPVGVQAIGKDESKHKYSQNNNSKHKDKMNKFQSIQEERQQNEVQMSGYQSGEQQSHEQSLFKLTNQNPTPPPEQPPKPAEQLQKYTHQNSVPHSLQYRKAPQSLTPIPPPLQPFQNDPSLLSKLQGVLYQFYLRQPEFTMKTLVAEVGRILEDEFKVPLLLHQKIIDKWVQVFLAKVTTNANQNSGHL